MSVYARIRVQNIQKSMWLMFIFRSIFQSKIYIVLNGTVSCFDMCAFCIAALPVDVISAK